VTRPRRTARLILPLLAAAALLVGCDDDSPEAEPAPEAAEEATPSPEETAPEEATGPPTRVEKPEDGFALELPPGWEEVPLEEFGSTLERGAESDAQLDELLTEQVRAAVAQGARLFAVQGEEGTNLIVNISDSGGETLDAVEPQVVPQLEQLGFTDTATEEVTLPAGDAIRLTTTSPVAGGLEQVQYYLIREDELIVLALTAPQGSSTDDADAIAESFEFLEPEPEPEAEPAPEPEPAPAPAPE
jgi:pyruvate dehydrogenase E2 component (dihydrolipoamide acetyltransferase)